MTETGETQSISEIGIDMFNNLVTVLEDRESRGINRNGWNGTSANLKESVKEGRLCPASSFAIVADGLTRFKPSEPRAVENTDSLRKLGDILLEGSNVYEQASQIDEETIKGQIKSWVESHGGEFNESMNWREFINEKGNKLRSKADAIEAANS